MRVTIQEVRDIISTELTDAVITAYITSAEAVVTGNLTGVLSATLRKEIGRWLTAHMIASTQERMAMKEGAGGAYIEYTGQYGQGLKSTSYGQMVLSLDSSGTMAGLGEKRAWMIAIPQTY